MAHIRNKKGPRASVPQFGGWDKKGGPASEVSSGYTVVFSRARADRQHQKTDLTGVKRQSQLEDHHHHQQNHNLDDDDNNYNPITKNNKAHHHHHHRPPPSPPHYHHHKKHDRHGKPEEEELASASSATLYPMGNRRSKIMSWFFCCFRP